MADRIDGIVPVMLTPFTPDNAVDYDGLERLTHWYLENGADALFAVCQSSEMQALSLEERVNVARFVVRTAAGRVPVIASGHVSDAPGDQAAELAAMADTGVDGLVLVTNRLDTGNAGAGAFRRNLADLMVALPSDMPLGLYECPAPFRRLLADDELKLCLDTGRFVVLKDVSCDLATVKRRAALVAGTGFSVVNANAAIAHQAMRAGSRGFSGVFTNFHPDLYAWLYRHRDDETPLVADLTVFLALAATAEPMGYPALAKLYHQRLGTFASINARVIDFDIRERYWAVETILAHIETGTRIFRERVARAGD